MKTGLKRLAVAASTLGFLGGCAQTGALEVQHRGVGLDTQISRSSADHHRAARQYENMAKELALRVEKHKKLLHHYEDNSYLYGRRGQDFRSQAVALERKYKLAAEKANAQAAFHYRMASEPTSLDYAAIGEPLQQLSNR